MKIFVLLGHPDATSFNAAIAGRYAQGAAACGHEVRTMELGRMHFDPVLWNGYQDVQELEPDLRQAWENINWCERWVIVYPVWWGSVPALLKGFLDRVMLPGRAFRYHEKDPFWDKLLKGRSAHLITTSDAPAIWLWWQYRNSDLNAMKQATLKFCGISPVRVTRIGRVKYLSAGQRAAWLDKVGNMNQSRR